MPTYDYKCDACGHTFELVQSIKADPIKRCPKCKKMKVKRLIGTGAGLIFKGSGFYITDYRDKSYGEKAKADAAPAADAPAASAPATTEAKSDPKTEAKSESKSETKSETKSEAKPSTPPPSESKSARSDSSKSRKR